jgi:hypothetical protein
MTASGTFWEVGAASNRCDMVDRDIRDSAPRALYHRKCPASTTFVGGQNGTMSRNVPCPVCPPNWNDLPICWGNWCSRLPLAVPPGAHGMASRPRFPAWTPIACRERTTENVWVKLSWIPFPDAVYTPEQARTLARVGKLLVANAHDAEHVFLMIRTPARRSP